MMKSADNNRQNETLVKTLEHNCSLYEGQLFISLCYGDGGGGYEDDDIEKAEEFIRENNIWDLAEITEPVDGEVTCTFILND